MPMHACDRMKMKHEIGVKHMNQKNGREACNISVKQEMKHMIEMCNECETCDR